MTPEPESQGVPWGEYRPLGVDPHDPKFTPKPDAVLAAVETFCRRYLGLHEGTWLPLALWAIGTHLFEKFMTYPYLAIVSALPGCGKTRLLEILALVSCRPWLTNTATPAVLFRKIASDRPTVLIDEAESLSNPKSEAAQALRSILNAGYRAGGSVSRCEPPKFKPVDFDVYSPKAFTVIGRLPDSVSDRCIVIAMQRHGRADRLERFTQRRVKGEVEAVRWSVESMVDQIRDAVAEAYERMPDLAFLRDREAEIWEPIFALCSVISPNRIPELQACAERLSGSKTAARQDDSYALRLLSDCRDVWPVDTESLPTKELVRLLSEIEDAPWFSGMGQRAEYELSARKLARLLRGFDIVPRNIRDGGAVLKGYLRSDFHAAFGHYLLRGGDLSATPLQGP